MKQYECPEHDQEFFLNKDSCSCCGRIFKILEARDKRGPIDPIFKKPMEVYWPGSKKGGVHGRVIENLGHTPQRFNTKEALRNFLKHNKVQEAR